MKRLLFILAGVIFLVFANAHADPSIYEGLWKGKTDQDYDFELTVRGNKIKYITTERIGGENCPFITLKGAHPVNLNPIWRKSGSAYRSISFMGEFAFDTVTGEYDSSADKWTGEWRWDFSNSELYGVDPPCMETGGGTWEANRTPRLTVMPTSFKNLEVVAVFDAPLSHPSGLAFDGSALWGAGHLSGEICRMDYSGVSTWFDPPGPYSTGLASDGTHLWNADDVEDKIYKLDTDGNVLSSFSAPGPSPTGLAFDGTYLWNADNIDMKIYKMDTAGNVLLSFNSPGPSPTGLAFDGTYLWNADRDHNKIYKLDTSGNIQASFNTPGTDPTGLAFDGTCLWNADGWDFSIYKIFETPGKVYLGRSQTRTFIVTNMGSSELLLGQLAFSGPNASEFILQYDGCSGQTLDTFETCSFDLGFMPLGEGPRIADLQIPSNDPDTLVFGMPLRMDASWMAGDIDHSGSVDVVDMILSLQVLAGIAPAKQIYRQTGICDHDEIRLAEAVYAAQRASGLRNQAPILISIGEKTIREHNALSFRVGGADFDGDDIVFSVSGIPDGAAFDPGTKLFTWTPGHDQVGTHPVTFQLEDLYKSKDEEVVNINVIANQSPQLSPIGQRTAYQDSKLEFTIYASDPELDTLTFSASNLPAGAVFSSATQTFSWTPSFSHPADFNVTFMVTDAYGGSDSETVTISVNAGTTLSVEHWDFILTQGAAEGTWTLTGETDGSITVDGVITSPDVTLIFEDGLVTISGPAFYFTASGIATSSTAPPDSNTSPFTFMVNGTTDNGQGSGGYTLTFTAYGWPEPIESNWEATRTSGAGITE